MDSVIQKNKSKCFLCGGGAFEPLDRHHCFEGSNRKNSEKYGLVVWLHHHKCHLYGESAVHNNIDAERALKAKAQQKAMEHYNWSMEDWLKIFRKNYL
jgi:hypothetical protein